MSQEHTVDDVADELRLHPNTVRLLIARGYFPGAYKTGRGGRTSPWRIPERAVEDYRARQPHAPEWRP